MCGFETTVSFVSSLREAEEGNWLFCFSGDFCQTGPCGARTGLCPGGAGRSPIWGGNRPKRASCGRTGGLRGFVGRPGCVDQCRKERKGRRIPLEGSGRDLRHLPGNPHGRKRGKCRTLFLPCPTKYRWTWSAAHKIRDFIHGDLPALHPSYGFRTGTQAAAGRGATGPKFSASLASLTGKVTVMFSSR